MMEETLERESSEICGFCGKIAKQKCSGCKIVYYCSREHQKAHWKTHSGNCHCYKLAIDTRLGRHYVATRDIEIGEIVIREKVPLLASPPQITPPICLVCYVILTADNSRACENCGWPICHDCDKHDDNGGECEFTMKKRDSRVTINDFELPHPIYRSIGVARALAMREKHNEAYQRLMRLEDHCHEASGQRNDARDIAKFVKRFFNVEDIDENEIEKIVGIIQINGHEVPTTVTPHIAVYDEASYLEHNCRANCSKSFTENGGIVIRAAVPISKGNHITICYTDPLWGVANRRHHLAETKFFDCTCERCKDPTEFGTMFNAIKCIKNECTGYMLPPTFIICDEKFPDFACSKCAATISWNKVDELLEKIGMELSIMKKDDVNACKEFIDRQSKILHENHFYNVDVKLALAQIIGQQDGGLPAVPDDLLTEKILLCKKLSVLLETLVPAENRVRGVLLFEMHAGIAEFGRRQGPDALRGLLMESKKVLAESYQLLRHEPEILPEGKIAKQAQKNLREIDVIITTLLQSTASPT